MKKLIVLLLALSLVLLSSCTGTKAPDETDAPAWEGSVWDGSVADGFSAGAGTEDAPFEIASAAELAYLAKSVNEGISYADAYIVLTCHIDLANIEWAPIGNGVNNFSGSFDGGGHTIKGLSVTKGHFFEREYYEGKFSRECVIGLFGCCTSATLLDLVIQQPRLSATHQGEGAPVVMGALTGELQANGGTVVENITVIGGEIYLEFLGSGGSASDIGGVIGLAHDGDGGDITIRNLQADTSLVAGWGFSGYVGGLVGRATSEDDFVCENANCKLQVGYTYEDDAARGPVVAAFGSTSAYDGSFKLADIYSEITMTKLWKLYHGYPNYTAYGMIGEVYGNGDYEFENLSGYVRQQEGEESMTELALYEISDRVTYTEKNCKGAIEKP